MDISNLIDAIQSGDVQDSNNAFNDVMMTRVNDSLDNHKKDIAGSMYGTVDTDVEQDADV